MVTGTVLALVGRWGGGSGKGLCFNCGGSSGTEILRLGGIGGDVGAGGIGGSSGNATMNGGVDGTS